MDERSMFVDETLELKGEIRGKLFIRCTIIPVGDLDIRACIFRRIIPKSPFTIGDLWGLKEVDGPYEVSVTECMFDQDHGDSYRMDTPRAWGLQQRDPGDGVFFHPDYESQTRWTPPLLSPGIPWSGSFTDDKESPNA